MMRHCYDDMRSGNHRNILDFSARVLAIFSDYCAEVRLEFIGLTSCQYCRDCRGRDGRHD